MPATKLPMRDSETAHLSDAAFFAQTDLSDWVSLHIKGTLRWYHAAYRLTDPSPQQLAAHRLPVGPVARYRAVRIAQASVRSEKRASGERWIYESRQETLVRGPFEAAKALSIGVMVVMVPTRSATPLCWASVIEASDFFRAKGKTVLVDYTFAVREHSGAI